ncbi:MAG: hypothetical protein IPK94_07325 [Saprospiraceae bacterium]|nr:hypothetical protein [Saprospiraceae bacterium]
MNKDSDTGTIFAQFRYSGDQVFKTRTGLSIKKEFWDPKIQRAKSTRLFPLHVDYNLRLNRIEEAIQEYIVKPLPIIHPDEGRFQRCSVWPQGIQGNDFKQVPGNISPRA